MSSTVHLNGVVKVDGKSIAEIFWCRTHYILKAVGCRPESACDGQCIECKLLLQRKKLVRNLLKRIQRTEKKKPVSKFTNKSHLARVHLGEIEKEKGVHLRRSSKQVERAKAGCQRSKEQLKEIADNVKSLFGVRRYADALKKMHGLSIAESLIVRNLLRNSGNVRNFVCDEVFRFFRAMYLIAKPRAYNFVRVNLNGPHVSTIRRRSAFGEEVGHFRLGGALESNFQLIAKIYERVAEKHGRSQLGSELSEDETRVQGALRYDEASDSIVGLCGESSHILCDQDFNVISLKNKTDSEVVALMKNAVQQVPATYARAVVVNPLNRKMPRLVVVGQATCLKFDSGYVSNQWQRLEDFYRSYLEPILGPLVAHASDGDSRRRKLFEDTANVPLAQLCSQPSDLILSDPDYLHNAKKIFNQMDSNRGLLVLGKGNVSMSYLNRLIQEIDIFEHGIKHRDVSGDRDRMNFESCQRAAKKSAIESLQALNEEKNLGAESTLMYLKMLRAYLQIFLDISLSWIERIDRAYYCYIFLTMWKADFDQRPGLSTKENFISLQCFKDVLISCKFIILLCRNLRDRAETIAEELVGFNLINLGTDCVEQLFSSIGIWEAGARVYDLLFFQRFVMHVLEFRFIEAVDCTGIKFSRARENLESIFQSEFDKDKKFDARQFPSNQEIPDSMKKAFERAQKDLQELGCKADQTLEDICGAV